MAETLGDNPLAGRARPEIDSTVRSMAVMSYLLLYEPIQQGVRIMRIMHGSRDLPKAWRDPSVADQDSTSP